MPLLLDEEITWLNPGVYILLAYLFFNIYDYYLIREANGLLKEFENIGLEREDCVYKPDTEPNNNQQVTATTQTEIIPTNASVQTEIIPIDATVQTEIVPLDAAVQTEVVTIDAAVQTEIVPIDATVQTDTQSNTQPDTQTDTRPDTQPDTQTGAQPAPTPLAIDVGVQTDAQGPPKFFNRKPRLPTQPTEPGNAQPTGPVLIFPPEREIAIPPTDDSTRQILFAAIMVRHQAERNHLLATKNPININELAYDNTPYTNLHEYSFPPREDQAQQDSTERINKFMEQQKKLFPFKFDNLKIQHAIEIIITFVQLKQLPAFTCVYPPLSNNLDELAMSRSILNELFALNRKNRLLPLLRFLNKNSTGFNQDVDLLSGAIVTLFMVVLQIPLEQQNDSPFAHMPYILSNTLKCSDANFLCDYVLSCINGPLVTSQILKDVLPDEEETIDSFRTETDFSAIESAPFMKPIGEGATVSITPGFTVIPTDTPKSDLFKLDVDNHILEMNRIITEFLDLKHIPNPSTETERNNSSTSSINNGDSSNSPPDFTTPVTEENTDNIQQEATPDNTYNYYDAFFQTNNNNQTTSYEEPGTTNPARRTRTRRNSTHLDFNLPFQHPQFTTSTTPRANATQMHIPEQLNNLEQPLDNTEQQSSNSNQQSNDPEQTTNSNSTVTPNSNSTETPHTSQVSNSEHSLSASITQSVTSSNNSRSSSPERPSSLYFQRRRGAVIESSGDAPTAIANTTQPQQENENNNRSHDVEHIRPPPDSLPLSLPVAFRTENILDSSNKTSSPPERSQTIQNMLDDIGRSIDEAAAFSINVFSDISLRNEETTGDTNPTSFADISVNDNPNTQTPQPSNDDSLTRQLQEAEQMDSIYQNQAPYNVSTHPGATMNATEQNDSINQTREPSSTSSHQVAMINITEQTEDTRQTEQNEPELSISQLLGLGESQPIEFQTFDNAQDAAQHNNTTGQLLPPLSEYNAAGVIPLVQEANPNQNLNEPETEHIENVIPRVPPQFTNRITIDGLSTVTATHIERENADSLGGNSSALSTQLTESASSDRSQPASNPNILAPQPDFRMPLAPTSGGGASSSSSLNNPTSSQMFTLSSDASHYQADSNNNGGFLQNQRVIEDVLEEIENRASVPTARFNILEFSTNDYGPLGQLLADLETANFKAIQRFRAKFAHLITQAEHILGSDKIESFNEIHSLASNNRLTEETVTKLRLLQQAYNYFTRHIFNFEVFAHQYETYYVATQSLHLLQAFYIKSRTLIRMMAENSRLTVGVVLKVKPTVQEVVQMAFSMETLAKLYKLNNSAFTEENICRNLDRNLKVMVEDYYRLGEEFKTAYQHHWCTPFHPLPHMLDLPDILELDEEDGSNAYRTPTFKQPNTTIV